ncbi:hypothetical protein J3R30DRAFT_1137744 [Lentinula aciculospora]|uniref:Uncharacterized protein n=1 Tax=Lentinula aciculospora TaxID=153920 RepID=A0A9W9A0R1_9AGAR|nr:hypothetical protein J3R30DRAFT_1137744 [Lentinula aciculospora]
MSGLINDKFHTSSTTSPNTPKPPNTSNPSQPRTTTPRTTPRTAPRSPHENYLGKNGFTETPTTEGQKLEIHQHAVDILRYCGVGLPSVETIMNTDWVKPKPRPKPESSTSTSESIQKDIDDLRKRHITILSKLYDLNSSAYLDDIEDRYRSRNAVLDEDPRVWLGREVRKDINTYTQDELNSMIESSNAQKVSFVLSFFPRGGIISQKITFSAFFSLHVTSLSSQKKKELYAKTYPYPFSPTAPTPTHFPSISRHNYYYCKQLIELQRRKLLSSFGDEGQVGRQWGEEKGRKQREEEQLERKRKREKEEGEEGLRRGEVYNRQWREEEIRRQGQVEKDRSERLQRSEKSEKAFPLTIEEFDSKPKDFKNLIAKFLDGGTLQEKQLKTNNWTWEEVKPLMKIYGKDDKFRSRIITMVMMMPKSISSDPRRKIP